MRRRGRWEARGKRGMGRLLERLRELKGLGLKDLRALERPPGTPGEIELGAARRNSASLVIVASRRDGLDLLGWAHVAAQLCDDTPDINEVILAAPMFGARTRRAAQRASASGPCLRLVTAPALAESPEELLEQELFPPAGESPVRSVDPGSVVERVLRVLDGAAAVTGCAGLRRIPSGFLLYVRGLPVLQVTPGDETVVVTFTAPERRRVHVGELNFPRWGVELHEAVIQLAQDPRLLSDEVAQRERAVERLAGETGCRVTGRWLPWNADGSDPIDWVGIDRSGRPVLGVIRALPRLADAVGWIAALHALEEERAQWVPGAEGAPRLVLASERDEPRLRSLLARAGLELEQSTSGAAVLEGGERERRGRRRPRRRRRERGEGAGWSRRASAAPSAEHAASETPGAVSDERAEAETPAGDAAPFAEPVPESADASFDDEAYRPSSPVAEKTEASLEPDEEALAEPPARAPSGEEGRWETPRVLESSEAGAVKEDAGEEGDGDEPSGSDAVEMEIEATLAEEREQTEEDAGEAIEPEISRRRNPRAAIVVRNDPDAVLGALILARDRRNLVSFWVCSQENLMDFFKGRATDLPENADLLLVGFTAQPISQEVIRTVGLFRGRVQWFDHHEWPIEDVERLRDAIGRDSIVFEPRASSPLAAVTQVTQRRSRFTDKLIDLAGRRLSENDMTKWGYRVVGLLQRLAAKEGDYRTEIVAVLSGKPSELPDVESVYAQEEAWIEARDPRIVHFGEYQMAVLEVPSGLDSGELGRRVRLRSGARLSLVSREGDELVILGCNDEKRHINLSGMIDCVSSRLPWAHAVAGGDRTGRLRIENLSEHPERIEPLIGEIVKNRAILYG